MIKCPHKDNCSWWKSESISQFGWREIRGEHHILPSLSTVIFRLLRPPLEPFNLTSCPRSQLLGGNDFSKPLRLKCQGVKQSPGGHLHLEEHWTQVYERWIQPWRPTDQLWDCGSGTPPSHLSWLLFPSDNTSTQACVCKKGTISACVTGKFMSWGSL